MSRRAGPGLRAGPAGRAPSPPSRTVGDDGDLAADPLVADSPWRDRRLWVVQLVVLVAYALRLVVEVHITRAAAPVPGIPDFSTLGLFLWPVLYAAVTMGPTGAAVTTAWIALLSVPRDLEFLGGADPVAVWAESTQVAALCLVAVVVGRRVAAERAAVARAERARRAHLAAEARYRALFDASESPTVLVDRTGGVVEANAAALALTVRAPTVLADVVGPAVAERCLQAEPGDEGLVSLGDGPALRRYRLAVSGLPAEGGLGTAAGDGSGDGLVQVVLTDVTAESSRRETAEAFARAVVEAQEEERRHLAQELHDGPLQTLVHLVRQLDVVGGQVTGGEVPGAQVGGGEVPGAQVGGDEVPGAQVGGGEVPGAQVGGDEVPGALVTGAEAPGGGSEDPARSGQAPGCCVPGSQAPGNHVSGALAGLRGLGMDLVDELRRITRGLRPSALDDLGLVASLRRLLDDVAARSGIETTLGVTGSERRLPAPLELTVFRVAQEAVGNAERHARPGRIAVGIAFEDGLVRLLVTDDGTGFAGVQPGAPRRPGALGLSGMGERLHLAGGSLVVHTAPGAGTTVEATVPDRRPGSAVPG